MPDCEKKIKKTKNIRLPTPGPRPSAVEALRRPEHPLVVARAIRVVRKRVGDRPTEACYLQFPPTTGQMACVRDARASPQPFRFPASAGGWVVPTVNFTLKRLGRTSRRTRRIRAEFVFHRETRKTCTIGKAENGSDSSSIDRKSVSVRFRFVAGPIVSRGSISIP